MDASCIHLLHRLNSCTIKTDRYRNSFLWADETVAYYHMVNKGTSQMLKGTVAGVKCSHLATCSSKSRRYSCTRPVPCWQQQEFSILCQADKVLTPHTHTIKLLDSNYSNTLAVCALGHVTHTFSACEMDCLGDERSDATSCTSVLTPLPPMFACAVGQHLVPYTLVCDYHPDCVDSSDENFCVFPPCPLDTMACGNGQVRWCCDTLAGGDH